MKALHLICLRVTAVLKLSGLTLLALYISACGAGNEGSKLSSTNTQNADWQRLLDQLDLPDKSVDEISIPDDIKTHPESQFESFEIRVVYKDESKRWSTLSSQLDRLKVISESDNQSDWSFSSIARARVSSGSELKQTLTTREDLSRVALNLANSTGQQMIVKDTTLEFSANSECTSVITLNGRDALDDVFSFSAAPDTCPQSTSTGFLNQWEFLGTPLQGTVSDSPIDGTLWLTHRWGNVVSPGGAVLFDQIRIQLSDAEGPISLSVSRTKRTSGRGPRTVSAFLVDDKGRREAVEVEWEDQSFAASPETGLSYPQVVLLQIPTRGYALRLQPIAEFLEIVDSLGSRASGGVLVSGSHAGVGFLDFQPLTLKE